jgi:hypothetical protein
VSDVKTIGIEALKTFSVAIAPSKAEKITENEKECSNMLSFEHVE